MAFFSSLLFFLRSLAHQPFFDQRVIDVGSSGRKHIGKGVRGFIVIMGWDGATVLMWPAILRSGQAVAVWFRFEPHARCSLRSAFG